jgi:hypothetical protein
MNERIEKLAIQAGLESVSDNLFYAYNENLERFAELVRQDEREACAEHYLAIMRDAVEQAVLREREACAQLVERMSDSTWTFCNFAEAIRARGEK